MKDELDQGLDNSSFENVDPRHEDEVGIAVSERSHHDDDRRENEADDNEEDYYPSGDEYEIEDETEAMEHETSDELKAEAEEDEELAHEIANEIEEPNEYPENDEMDENDDGFTSEEEMIEEKETFFDKIKGNLIYILIALILIVPAAMKMYSIIFGTAPAPVEQAAPVGFTTEKTPAPSMNTKPATTETMPTAPLEKPSRVLPYSTPQAPVHTPLAPHMQEMPSTTMAPEIQPPQSGTPQPTPESMPTPVEQSTQQNNTADRSLLESMLPVGDGSPANSANMTEAQNSEQILNRYFDQETKVEQQLSDVLVRMNEMDARLTSLDDINKRLMALEESNAADLELSTELRQISEKVAQLEQSLMQLRQQPVPMAEMIPNQTSAPIVAPTAITVEAVIPGRAWVRNQDGVLMVVEVGDEIMGVGKVTRIDAREGIVATTTQVFKQ